MKAILKKIEMPDDIDYVLWHPIKMFFAASEESEELYCFGTTLETQFCTKGEYDIKEGLPDKLVEEKINYANTLIGKIFEINLYYFTVKELTNNKYVAFEITTGSGYVEYEDYETETIKDYHIASFMTKEDVIMNIKHTITMQGAQIFAFVNGVLPDGSTEEITTEFFFPKPIPEKKTFNIPYDKYPELTARYIINEIDCKEIRKGLNLAYQIKDRAIKEYDLDNYVYQIENYRKKVYSAKVANESLRKKLFFWEPKEVVEELNMNSDYVSLYKDSIILGRLYPLECEKADKEHAAECENRLRKQFLGEDVEEKEFKDKWLEFRQMLRKKYKGKEIIRPID